MKDLLQGITVKNEGSRRVLYTARNCQLVVQHTRAEAEADNEHFDGKMTEWRVDYAPRLSTQRSWSRARR